MPRLTRSKTPLLDRLVPKAAPPIRPAPPLPPGVREITGFERRRRPTPREEPADARAAGLSADGRPPTGENPSAPWPLGLSSRSEIRGPKSEGPSLLTVSALNRAAQAGLRRSFPVPVWVQGEIQGFARNAGRRNLFLDLVEKAPGENRIMARVTAVIFEETAEVLRRKLRDAGVGFLADDLEVKVLGEVDLYLPNGSFQLKILDVDPAWTLGRMALSREKILQILKAEGILELNRRRVLPEPPLSIGLITAPGSAAYHDFVHELSTSGFAFRVLVAPARMQGKATEGEVVDALFLLASRAPDAVCIVRGGGSRADLAWFDAAAIARAIARSPFPVVTGLGHEIDVSIADLAAHTSQKTPTAAARFLVERVAAFLGTLSERGRAIAEAAEKVAAREERRLREAVGALGPAARRRVEGKGREVAHAVRWLDPARLRRLLLRAGERLSARAEGLAGAARGRLGLARAALDGAAGRATAHEPARVLRRGFSITRGPSGRAIRSASEARPGERLTTELAEGSLESRVEDRSPSGIS